MSFRKHSANSVTGKIMASPDSVIASCLVLTDPINLSWHKDWETFEEERLKELGGDIAQAISDNNDDAVRKLQKGAFTRLVCACPGVHRQSCRWHRKKPGS
jgi:hypothetical protein